MLNASQIEKMNRQVVKDLAKEMVRDLKQLKNPQDLTPDGAYNLVQLIFSFWIAAGKTPETTKEELVQIVNEAYDDFLEQVKLPEY